MREGLLWFDRNPQHKLIDKVKQAATRYHTRFGIKPTVCYLNAVDFEGQPAEVNGITLRASPLMLRHHLWVGVEQETTQARAA
jgi:hypothetical protein